MSSGVQRSLLRGGDWLKFSPVFNASCSCAKTRDLRLSAAFKENALRLETFSMDFTDGFPDWTSHVGNKLSLKVDLFHLNGG